MSELENMTEIALAHDLVVTEVDGQYLFTMTAYEVVPNAVDGFRNEAKVIPAYKAASFGEACAFMLGVVFAKSAVYGARS